MALSKAELKGLYSTGDGSWRTPAALFAQLNDIFHFELDAAADEFDTLCDRHISPEMNALDDRPWPLAGSIWLNPPFGDGLYDWMVKVVVEAKRPHYPLIACLLPVRPETDWGQLIIAHAKCVLLFNRRVKYTHPDPKRSQKSPGFPSMLCVAHKKPWTAADRSTIHQLRKLGQVMIPLTAHGHVAC